jgi:hypothetical protein
MVQPQNSFPDGFPQDPQAAINFSYFLTDDEKKEWREWLGGATEEQKKEFVETLHAMWMENQKEAIPSGFNNSQEVSIPGGGDFGNPAGNPAENYGASSQSGQQSSVINPNPSNQGQGQTSSGPQIPEYGSSYGPSSAGNGFSNATGNSNSFSGQNYQQPPFKTKPGDQGFPGAQQGLQSPSPNQNPQPTFPQNQVNPKSPNFSGQNNSANYSGSQNQSQPPQDANKQPQSSSGSTPQAPQMNMSSPSTGSLPNDHQISQEKNNTSDNRSSEDNIKLFGEAKYTPNPILDGNQSKSSNQDKFGNNNSGSSQNPFDQVRNQTGDSQGQNKQSNNQRDSNNSQNSKKTSPNQGNQNKTGQANTQKPSKNDKNDNSASHPKSSLRKVREVDTRKALEDIYQQYLDSRDRTFTTEREYLENHSIFLDKVMRIVINFEDVIDYFDTLQEKLLEMNDKLVNQAKKAKKTEDEIDSRLNDLQFQINEIKSQVEGTGREVRRTKNDLNQKYREASDQIVSFGADSFKDDGLLYKMDTVISRLEKLENEVQRERGSERLSIRERLRKMGNKVPPKPSAAISEETEPQSFKSNRRKDNKSYQRENQSNRSNNGNNNANSNPFNSNNNQNFESEQVPSPNVPSSSNDQSYSENAQQDGSNKAGTIDLRGII